jgi:hypothetical protein
MTMTNGKKSMLKPSVDKAILATLAFFSLSKVPLTKHRIFELLYKFKANEEQVNQVLEKLVVKNKIYKTDGLYSLEPFNPREYEFTKEETSKRWKRVDRYFWLLSLIPFVEHLSIINSLSFGNTTDESDIDFFVITKPNRLYFVRSMIIVLFRLLGVYKTRRKINKQFCFGFYVTPEKLDLRPLMLPDGDPYFVFWLSNMIPVLNEERYDQLIGANEWIYDFFPNFNPIQRRHHLKRPNVILQGLKFIFEVLLYMPSIILEPLIRWIHVRHTFNLPENHLPTSTTIAEKNILKLHAIDPRKDIRARFRELLHKI